MLRIMTRVNFNARVRGERTVGTGAFATLLLCGILGSGCSNDEQRQERPAPTVIVDTPVIRTITESFRYNGTLRSVEEAAIRARVPGFLERIEFKPSTNVEPGDLLFVIEQAPYEVALEKAKGALERTEAQLGLAEARLERRRAASERGASTEIELIESEATVRQRAGEVRMARAEVRQAELDLSYTEVRSPIAGRVDENLVDVGNLVGAGENTLLTTVRRMRPIYAYFDVSESIALQYFSKGRDGEIRDNSQTAYLGLANEEGYPHSGAIDYVDNTLDPSTGTIRVRAVFDNPDGLLYPGLYARIRVPFQEIEDAVLIDRNALQRDLEGDYVIIIDDDEAARRRYVAIGERREDNLLHVRSGLDGDERYVVSGMQKARPGTTVSAQTREEMERQRSRSEEAGGSDQGAGSGRSEDAPQ